MVGGKHALVVVACVAGVGAWGGLYTVDEDTVPTYAAELFGPGSEGRSPMWPMGDHDDSADTPDETIMPTVRVSLPTVDTGSGTITFTLKGGATFGESVASTNFFASNDDGTGPGVVATNGIAIEAGGAKGDSFVTVSVNGSTTDGLGDTDRTIDPADPDGDGEQEAAEDIPVRDFYFKLPKLMGLSILAGGTDVKASNVVTVAVSAESTSGTFPDGALELDDKDDNKATTVSSVVVMSEHAVKMSKVSANGTARIDISDRAMLQGHVHPWATLLGGNPHYNPNTYAVMGESWAAQILRVEIMVTGQATSGKDLLQWSGERVDSDVAGVLDVDVTGTRGALQDGAARIFVNWNGDPAANVPTPPATRGIDADEELTNDGMAAMFTRGGFSIDPGETDEDEQTAVHTVGVYYIPDGKTDLAHGATISASAIVNYTLRTSTDEGAKSGTATLALHGVSGALKAYAIPFDGNGKNDKANVRVRCEVGDHFTSSASCRVFLECWDDMGMRSFGEAGMIAANALETWNSAAIEGVVGVMDPMSRHSCRVLSTGTPSVQTLVRDGSSGTLVNNSYVEDNMM